MSPRDFADAVMGYCLLVGGSVTSWGRTTKHNAAVGGVPTSMHLRWLAADVVYDGQLVIEDAHSAAANRGLQVFREADHDHLSPAGGPR